MERRYKIFYGYSYVFNPLPYSAELWQTLFGLEYSGYISSDASLVITNKGKKRVSEQSKLSDFRIIYNSIRDAYKNISRLSKKEIYDAIYAKIS
ncbi:MAG: hypothetical protein FE041_03390 [Thermoplasmata archaeon]|nr:MAG: hypothetical protein FE041_03390 [Thermoplasmata archaeon]